MADLTPPGSAGDPLDPGASSTPDSSASDANAPGTAARRGAHRAPAKPQRVLVVGLIAVAAVVALLVAFGSCGGGFDSGEGVVNGTPGVTTAPPTTTSTPTSTTSPTATATPSATPTTRPPSTPPRTTPPRTTRPPTATASPSPTTGPRIPVDVLNGTNIAGLAAQSATQVRAAGWTVGSVGNWRGSTVSTETVFYAPGDEGSARRLARELSGAQQVRAALSGMSTSRLTLVVRP